MTLAQDHPLLDRLRHEGVEVRAEEPVPMACPGSEEQIQAVLALAEEADARVVPMGAGSKLGWCRPEVARDGADLLLSVARLSNVTEYVAGDGVVTAEAGCPLETLEHTVAAGGHRLTPTLAVPEGQTLGGAIASGISGPDRVRHGPFRHHVLGLRVMLSDGRTATSGGKLVKNVTGFDLHRLYTGSRGTLCVILSASLRLFPEPERLVGISVESDSVEELLEESCAFANQPSPPLAVSIHGTPGGTWTLDLVLAGRSAQLDADLQDLPARMREGLRTEGDGAAALLREIASREGRPGLWPQAKMTTRPTQLPAAVQALGAEVSPGGGHLALQPTEGIGFLFAPDLADADPAVQVERLNHWRKQVSSAGGRLDPMAVDSLVHGELAPGADAGIRERWAVSLRNRLDPRGRFRSPSFPCKP